MDTDTTFDFEEENLSSTNQQDLICSACGGHLKFDPASNKLKCETCGAEFDIEASTKKIKELDFDKFVEENMGTIEMQTLRRECGIGPLPVLRLYSGGYQHNSRNAD